MRVIILLSLILLSSLLADTNKNIWLKKYQNYKNYNTLITNITKLQQKINTIKKDQKLKNQLEKKMQIYNSKLSLYEKNSSFDDILRVYKYDIPTITLYDYIFKRSQDELNRVISKYNSIKSEYYIAQSMLENSHKSTKEKNPKDEKVQSLKEDIEYFNEYAENIEKRYQLLQESKDELDRKYQEYKDETLSAHIITLATLIIIYIAYKLLHFLLFSKDQEAKQKYQKLLSILFVLSILIYIIFRYIESFTYLLTFLGLISAALVIANREIIQNIIASIYIFFTNNIRVGDRVMVQYDTKHTIGDIVEITLMKIKLIETTDYNSIKEIKSTGRVIYVPNSYIFTKVFYNYSSKKDSTIYDLIEFDIDASSDFDIVDTITTDICHSLEISPTISYSLNSTKSAINTQISYQVYYKDATKIKGELTIKLYKEYLKTIAIKLKSSKKITQKDDE
jgi:small-conductance mechanosensitive channel